MNFKKKTLVVLLAAAMVCAFALPMTAYGTTKITLPEITLSDGSNFNQMFVGKEYSLKVAGHDANDVYFKTGDKSVLTFSGQKAVPVKPGTARILAYSKLTKKFLAKKIIVYIYKRANTVKADVKDITLYVGESYVLKASLDPNDSSDVVRFISADKTIAGVGYTDGKIIGKAAGTTTVKVLAKKNRDVLDTSKYNRVFLVNVKVISNNGVELTGVNQYGNNYLSLDFLNDISAAGLTAGDVYIKDEATGKSFPIMSASFGAKYGSVFTQSNFTPGNKYLVRVYGKELEFTAKYISSSSGGGGEGTTDNPMDGQNVGAVK